MGEGWGGNFRDERKTTWNQNDDKAHHEMCTQIVCGRLVGRGLVRVDTPAYGDCQFEAVCMSAKLLVSASVLRKQVCDDMDRRRIYPKDFIDYMRVEGNYGNE